MSMVVKAQKDPEMGVDNNILPTYISSFSKLWNLYDRICVK